MTAHRGFAMPFAAVYPAYVNKAVRKGRPKQEVDRNCDVVPYRLATTCPRP